MRFRIRRLARRVGLLGEYAPLHAGADLDAVEMVRITRASWAAGTRRHPYGEAVS